MLVANPGHTPYSFSSNKINNQTNKTKSVTTTKNLLKSKQTSTDILSNSSSTSTLSSLSSTKTTSTVSELIGKPSTSFDVIKTTSSKYNDVLNTISVRINRGTELIKQTVNKALFSKIPPTFGGLLTVPPTSIHRSPYSCDRNAKSTDSLKLEMCHFKPIRTVPTTPCKKNKIIIKTPKAKRIQRTVSIRYTPNKSAISLLLTSQNSAFYLVKHSKELKIKTSTVTKAHSINTVTSTTLKNDDVNVKGTRINSLSKDIPTTANVQQKSSIINLKRIRNDSNSSLNTIDSKKLRLNNKSTTIRRKSSNATTTSTISIKDNKNNDKTNGLIVKNGERKSIRIHNRKLKKNMELNNINGKLIKNVQINLYNKGENREEKKKNESVIITRRSYRNCKAANNNNNCNITINNVNNCNNEENKMKTRNSTRNSNNNNTINTNNRNSKNKKEIINTKSKLSLAEGKSNQQKRKITSADKQKSTKNCKNQNSMNTNNCVRNLRPRVQKK